MLVTLRNGSQLLQAQVYAIDDQFTAMQRREGFAIAFQLVTKCREPDHKLYGDSLPILQKWCLIEPDGNVKPDVRNVILSSAKGEGLDMLFVSPIAGDSSRATGALNDGEEAARVSVAAGQQQAKRKKSKARRQRTEPEPKRAGPKPPAHLMVLDS